MFTLNGYTVNTVEQAQSILMLAVLKNDKRVAQQARAVIDKLLAQRSEHNERSE